MTKQQPEGFPPARIVFRVGHAWVEPGGDKKSAKAQEWRLLRHLLTGRSVHWLEGFVLFEEWRTKKQKGQYQDRFMSLVSKAKKFPFDDLKIKDAEIESVPGAKGYWKLAWTGDWAMDSNVAEGLRLTEKAAGCFRNEDSESGWSFIRDAWAQWPDASSLSRAVSLSPQLPADHKAYDECLAETKKCIESYQEALLGAIAKVTDLVASGRECLPFDVASKVLGSWIGEVSVSCESLRRMAGYVPKKPEKVNKTTNLFLEKAEDYLKYCNDLKTYTTADASVQKGMDEKERSRLLEELRDGDFVENAVKQVAQPYKDLEYRGIDERDVEESREDALREFLRSEDVVTSESRTLFGRFCVYLRKQVEVRRGTRFLEEAAEDRLLDPEERKARMESLLKELKGKSDLQASVKQIINEMAQPEKPTEESRSSEGLRRHFTSFDSFIEERTRLFCGRKFVFKELEKFFKQYRSGYFVITGDPGIGKSSVMVRLVQRQGLSVYHFNSTTEGINTPGQFLKNVCARLIVAYGLSHLSLPEGYNESGAFLRLLLTEASKRLGKGERLVIPVDALDEVEQPGSGQWLFLPSELPAGVYIVVTTRRGGEARLNVMNRYSMDFGAFPDDNMEDARSYVKLHIRRPGITKWVKERDLDEKTFTEAMVAKSEGNFMYLRHVLPEIERGFYKSQEFEAIPTGLGGYYEDHWRRMGMRDKQRPKTKINILYVLSAAHKPVSRDLLADFSGQEETVVQEVLDEWEQFLHHQSMDGQCRHSLYHASFREFLYQKDIVGAAGVSLKKIIKQIADNLWEELSGK